MIINTFIILIVPLHQAEYTFANAAVSESLILYPSAILRNTYKRNNFQIQYRFTSMIKQRNDFPTSLKYKFHILSAKFPDSFKQSINAKPLTDGINNKIRIESKDEEDQPQLNNLSISSIEKKEKKIDQNGNASIISSKSDISLISNLKEKSSGSTVKFKHLASKLGNNEQIIQEEQIKNISSPSSNNKVSDKLQPETKIQSQIQKQNMKQKGQLDLLKDDSDDQSEINRRKLQKIKKSRGRGNKSNLNISNQSMQQKSADKSKQNISQNIDKLQSSSLSISLVQSKSYESKMPPKSINHSMDNQIEKMPESATETRQNTHHQKQQQQKDLVKQAELQCQNKMIEPIEPVEPVEHVEPVEEQQVDQANLSIEEESEGKNQSQNDAEIQISVHEDIHGPNQYSNSPLVQRFLNQFEKQTGRTWNQQSSITLINQPKQRKTRRYEQSQSEQQAKEQKQEKDKESMAKMAQMQQKLQKMQKNYEQMSEKLSKLDLLSAIQEKLNKLQIVNNILSSENRELKIQISSLKDRVGEYEGKNKKMQQELVSLEQSMQLKTKGLTNQLINLGNNLFERQSNHSQIGFGSKSE